MDAGAIVFLGIHDLQTPTHMPNHHEGFKMLQGCLAIRIIRTSLGTPKHPIARAKLKAGHTIA